MQKGLVLAVAVLCLIAPFPIPSPKAQAEPEKEEPPSMQLTVENVLNPVSPQLQAIVVAPPTPEPTPKPKPVHKVLPALRVSQDNSEIIGLIEKWADYYGVSRDTLLRVANCESGYRPDAVNGVYYAKDGSTPTGLFQFVKGTYTKNAAAIGLPERDERLNPDHAAQVAAYMFSIGQAHQWECK